METFQGVSEKQNLEKDSSLIYALSTLQLSLCSLAIPLAPTAPTHTITKWWCWYFDDQFMSGWAGPCVWTHFHWFHLKTGQSFQSEKGMGCQDWSLIIKKNGGGTLRLEIEREMYQKAFLSKPTPTSTRLAVNSTNYWLVVEESSSWQQSSWWKILWVNTKNPSPPLCSPHPRAVPPVSHWSTEGVNVYVSCSTHKLAHTHTHRATWDQLLRDKRLFFSLQSKLGFWVKKQGTYGPPPKVLWESQSRFQTHFGGKTPVNRKQHISSSVSLAKTLKD